MSPVPKLRGEQRGVVEGGGGGRGNELPVANLPRRKNNKEKMKCEPGAERSQASQAET